MGFSPLRDLRMITLLCFGANLFSAMPPGPGAVAQQSADEEAVFTAARATTDPAGRASALETFLRQFPAGARSNVARQLLLEIYVNSTSDHTAEIHRVGLARIAAANAGLERWLEEAHLADTLADAGENGIDLADARLWAAGAVAALTEPAYRRQNAALQRRYRLPPLTQGQIHRQFAHDRATALAALANVQLRLAAPAAAAPPLAEATHLDPHAGEVLRLSGELALVQQHPQEALAAFIEASAVSPLSPLWHARMLALFNDREPGGAAALEGRIDEAYHALYPPVFALPARHLPPGGHPALLELFTGSDCAPCAGPDLAVDSLLGSYPRSDLIALEYDEHIPRPDPLANPDTADRAAYYAVDATPVAFLDGEPAQLLGSGRADVENIVVGLGDQIEGEAMLPSGLRLSVAVDRGREGPIEITAAMAVNPGARGEAATPTTGVVSLHGLQRAVLYVALAQEDIRYTGQNGVRFHRMVVRALRQTPAAALLGRPAHFAFDPADLDRRQRAYLTGYETHNDRFVTFRFPLTEIPIRTDHLAVVAWVQDPLSRQVLQSAFAAVNPR